MNTEDILDLLRDKYNHHEGELQANLSGLYEGHGVNYWDYIHLDTLQTLQHTRTDYDDEIIFIVYHQITELYFLLIKSELRKITDKERKEFLDLKFWYRRLGRIVNYISKLTQSFDVLMPGQGNEMNNYLDKEEFLKFRLALMPASGFQTVSLREIELMSTSLHNLLHPSKRKELAANKEIDELLSNVYWKAGGRIDDGSGKSFHEMQAIRTLVEFEKKYDPYIKELANQFKDRNLEHLYFNYKPKTSSERNALNKIRSDATLRVMLHQFSNGLNVNWKENHLRIISMHMSTTQHGTGGTNWRDFLPPERQALHFFPGLNQE